MCTITIVNVVTLICHYLSLQAGMESDILDTQRIGGIVRTASRDPYWSLIQRNVSLKTALWLLGTSTRPGDDARSSFTSSCGDLFDRLLKTDTSSSAKRWSRHCGSDTTSLHCIRKTGYRSDEVMSSVSTFPSTTRYRGLGWRVMAAMNTSTSTTTICTDHQLGLHRRQPLNLRRVRAYHVTLHSTVLSQIGTLVANTRWMLR